MERRVPSSRAMNSRACRSRSSVPDSRAVASPGLDGRDVGGVDPGQPTVPVAPPDRLRNGVEEAGEGRQAATGLVQGLAQLHQLASFLGRLAQPQEGATGDGLSLRIDAAAGLAAQVEPEARAADPKGLDRRLQLGGVRGEEPGAEGEDPPRRAARGANAIEG